MDLRRALGYLIGIQKPNDGKNGWDDYAGCSQQEDGNAPGYTTEKSIDFIS
jgi:hypothetical protein